MLGTSTVTSSKQLGTRKQFYGTVLLFLVVAFFVSQNCRKDTRPKSKSSCSTADAAFLSSWAFVILCTWLQLVKVTSSVFDCAQLHSIPDDWGPWNGGWKLKQDKRQEKVTLKFNSISGGSTSWGVCGDKSDSKEYVWLPLQWAKLLALQREIRYDLLHMGTFVNMRYVRAMYIMRWMTVLEDHP